MTRPYTDAEWHFLCSAYTSRRGNRRRKRQMQCGYNDHYQCKHVDRRQVILARIHAAEMRVGVDTDTSMWFNLDMTTEPNTSKLDNAAADLAILVVDHMEAATMADPDWDAEELNRFAPYAALVELVGYEEADTYIEREQDNR